MSPLGKSGQYFMNPNEMKRRGDMPDDKSAPAVDPDPQQDAEAGDGMRHHQIDEMPEGGAHSIRTNADGTTEEMDHDSFEDACAACGGEDDEGDSDEDGPAQNSPMDMSDMNDMAGIYDKATRK